MKTKPGTETEPRTDRERRAIEAVREVVGDDVTLTIHRAGRRDVAVRLSGLDTRDADRWAMPLSAAVGGGKFVRGDAFVAVWLP